MKRWILVVEDEPDMRDAIKGYLEINYGEDVVVVEAKDGLEATTKLHFQAFSCIITDLNMPRKNGWKLIEEAKGSTLNGNTPIIAITGHDVDPEDRKFAVDILYKPFSIQTLLELIDKKCQSRPEVRIASDLINKLTTKTLACFEEFRGIIADQGQPTTKPAGDKLPGQLQLLFEVSHKEQKFEVIMCFESRLLDYLEVHHLSESGTEPLKYFMQNVIEPSVLELEDKSLKLNSMQPLIPEEVQSFSRHEAILIPIATSKGSVEFALIKSSQNETPPV